MAGGLFALLDDIAALAKLAAASVDDVGAATGRASAKAVGVVVDDTAVTPRYVTGVTPQRELPMIKRITIGSLRNKLLIILPVALVLSQFAPWALTPLLMLGGTYLSFEGAEKIWEKISGHAEEPADTAAEPPPGSTHAARSGADAPADAEGPEGDGRDAGSADAAGETEAKTVAGAIRTDFILSSEIMVIALNEVASEPLLSRAIILVIVGILITIGVYGVVALIVKMDDIGLHLTTRRSPGAQRIGRLLVEGMPKLLAALALIGIVAMLWVGGHILLTGASTLGWEAPYALVHHAEEAVTHAAGPLGGVLGWLTNTLGSAIAGLIVGAAVVAILHAVHGIRHGRRADHEGHAGHADHDDQAGHDGRAERTGHDGHAEHGGDDRGASTRVRHVDETPR